MRYIIGGMIVAGCLAMAACATDRQVADYVCTHQITIVTAANTALQAAPAIRDATVREAVITSARTQLALVKACPNSIIPPDQETVQISH